MTKSNVLEPRQSVMSKLFISHAVVDGAKHATGLIQRLEPAGYPCWIAPRDVTPGRTYPAQIIAAVRECLGFLLLVTPEANQSPDVLQEVQIAHAHKKVIVPIIFEHTAPCDDLAYFLAVRQRISWTTVDAVYLSVVQTFPLQKPDSKDVAESGKPMDAQLAVSVAAASEAGFYGVFKMKVQSTNSEGNVAWLSSQVDYRDPRCLSVKIERAARRQLTAMYGHDPTQFFMGKTITVCGTARKQKIYFGLTDKYYHQTHIDVSDVEQIKVQD